MSRDSVFFTGQAFAAARGLFAVSMFAPGHPTAFTTARPSTRDRAGAAPRVASPRHRARTRATRRWRDALLGAALLFGVAACTWQGIKPDAAGPRRLYISGDTPHLGADRIALIAAPYLAASFFNVNIGQLRDRLAAEPWVQTVSVARHWPDGVVITVAEHRPIARWGAHAVLAADGAVFTPKADTRPAHLIRLDGPADEGPKVYRRYRQLAAMLSGHDARIASLALNARGGWSARLANGLELRLGREGLRSRMQRFVRFALGRPRARQALQDAAYIDLRYSDGFAVGGHRPAPPTPTDQENKNEQAA